MNFREYIEFIEAMTMSVDVDMQNIGDSDSIIKCSFEHDGREYQVWMTKSVYKEIDNVWEVVFQGPHGVSTTNFSGTGSSAVYNKMLSCVKKLFDSKEVAGIKFKPAEMGMAIPYDLFYRNFLRPSPPKGAGFLMVTPDLYLSKDKIRELDYTDQVIPANRLHVAKIELAKVRKAIGRIYDRINRGKAFATDKKNLEDLEAKRDQIDAHHGAMERDFYGKMSSSNHRRSQVRQRAEAEALRLSDEREAERRRIRDEKMQKINSLLDKTLVRRGELPASDIVDSYMIEQLKSAPWIAITGDVGESNLRLMIGSDKLTQYRILRSYFEAFDYIVENFVEMSAVQKRSLAKRIYSFFIGMPKHDIDIRVPNLPKDLQVELNNLGPIVRGVEKLKTGVKKIPMQTYRYWSGKPEPEEEEPSLLGRWDTL
jgi:hypothetical protein